MRNSPAIILLLTIASLFPASAHPGLSVDAGGALLKDGKPYRAIGVNYFDCFLRTLLDANDTSYDTGFATLSAKGIPFVRFCAGGFWPRESRLYLDDRAEFFRRFDRVVESASKHGIGMIPSLFWFDSTVPDLVGESVDQWANPRSKTQGFMRQYVREFVSRYRDNPAIWGWEFGNEYALRASLPNASENRPPVQSELGTPATRSAHDDVTFAMVCEAFADFAAEVRKYDPDRIIVTGDSLVRASAWHQEHETNWTSDTPEEFAEMLARLNPKPVNAISVHLYEDAQWRQLEQAIQVARKLKKPLFVGEFGVPATKPDAQAAFRRQLKAIRDNDVPLSALWVFDLANQKEFSVTATNDRAWQLELVSEANRALHKPNMPK